jgi:superfamily II DNA/RNA helicase
VVATPGRLIDLIQQSNKSEETKFLVLDKADEMSLSILKKLG